MEKKKNTEPGHEHPISSLTRAMVSIFGDMGFTLVEGPEIETEYYNFDALNVPEHHPARDLWDTFWLNPVSSRMLLRTHTSPVQVRYLEEHAPPVRIIVPGKVFRHEATDATHEAQFYQIEGLAIGKDITLAHLKGTLELFFEKLFGKELSVRFRPSFFPFVEPGVEVDIECFKCFGNGCAICKKSGWIEIMGAGMIHPKVLESAGNYREGWQGFAFGIGIDRLNMLRYGIDDVRLSYTGDLRFVNQF